MKKVIRIAHLYYDLMNLYGENGNIKALEHFIERQGIKAEVTRYSLGDQIDFKKHDIYYLGEGSLANELLVMGDLSRFRDELKDAIEDGKMFLVTGNAMDIFGEKLILKDNNTLRGLHIFDYSSLQTKARFVGEVSYEFVHLKKDHGRRIIGFKNCESMIVDNDKEELFEGSNSIHYKNFFGMMFFGPVLVRNPYFTDYLLKSLFEEKGYEYTIEDSSTIYTAYHEYVKNFAPVDNLD